MVAPVKRFGIPDITYQMTDIGDLKLLMDEPEKLTHEELMSLSKKERQARNKQATPKVKRILVDGNEMKINQRFLTSMCALYGFSPSIFTYFSPDELVSRIMQVRTGSSRIRIAVEHKDGVPMALGVTKPTKPLIDTNLLRGILQRVKPSLVRPDDNTDAESLVEYSDGVVTSWHAPRLESDFKIGDDLYQSRFVVETPIDGYGLPSAYISLLRVVCVNGAVGYAKAFRSQIQLGTEIGDAPATMERFVDSFNSEEGYAALRQRFEVATKSPVSLNEYASIYELLRGSAFKTLHQNDKGEEAAPWASQVSDKLEKLCGGIERYGVVNFDALSQKKRQLIPTNARMYDLLNLVTEVATHHADTIQGRKLQAWVGTTVSQEYDLEGVLADTEDPTDLFLGKKAKAGIKADRVAKATKPGSALPASPATDN